MLIRSKAKRRLIAGVFVVFAASFPSAVIAFQSAAPQAGAKASKPGDSKTNAKDGLRYRFVPPGSFTEGCSAQDKECFPDERPSRGVTLTKGFWLGETEVPQSAYERIAHANPSRFKGGNLPVDQVSWIEANTFCRGMGGRLPTEAEWEFAARGGTPGGRYGDVAQIAWYLDNAKGTTHPVAQKKPNAYGLYDMLGNVVEWTATIYGLRSAAPVTDPPGPAIGEFRELRGGGWFSDATVVRASYRSRIEPTDRDYNIGFRCVSE